MNPNSDNIHYDPLLGQFISVDPLYAKYPGVSSYTYCMNNPIEYWDPTGEEVELIFEDEADKQLVLYEMSEATGQIYGIDDDNKLYVDEAATEEAIESGELGEGSRKARKEINKMIGDDETLTVNVNKEGVSSGEGTNINLSMSEINSTVDAVNKDGAKHGYKDAGKSVNSAMHFFHEYGHTKFGGKLPDPIKMDVNDPNRYNRMSSKHTVGFTNQIRSQLNYPLRGNKINDTWNLYSGPQSVDDKSGNIIKSIPMPWGNVKMPN